MSEEKSLKEIYANEQKRYFFEQAQDSAAAYFAGLKAVAVESIRRHESSLLKIVEEMEKALQNADEVVELNGLEDDIPVTAAGIKSALASLNKWREENK